MSVKPFLSSFLSAWSSLLYGIENGHLIYAYWSVDQRALANHSPSYLFTQKHLPHCQLGYGHDSNGKEMVSGQDHGEEGVDLKKCTRNTNYRN